MVRNQKYYAKDIPLYDLIPDIEGLVHAEKLRAKILSLKKVNKSYCKKIRELVPKYLEYVNKQLNLIGYTPEIIRQRVLLLNDYYKAFDDEVEMPKKGTDQLRSSILEEFMYLLFKDYVLELQDNHSNKRDFISCGHVNAYSNIYFTAKNIDDFIENATPGVNFKEQDFSIYRRIRVEVEGKFVQTPKARTSGIYEDFINVPFLVIENKTFVDKTMLDGIIAAAEKLKNGSPHSFFIVVAETYTVGKKVDPAYSKIDQIYVLRKSKNRDYSKMIESDIVIRLFKDAKRHIEVQWYDIESSVANEGIVLPSYDN